MQQTGNPTLHICPPRKISFPRFNTILEMSHASIAVDADGKVIWKNIVSGEYSFLIYDDLLDQKTIIKCLNRAEKNLGILSKNKEFEWKELITINAVVDLPWRNTAKVAEHVKTYIVFS